MPIRDVSNRGGNIIGRYPSLKLGRMVSYESLIERDFICVLDFEPTIRWFEEQPLRLCYRDGEQDRHYTPDFQFISADQTVLVECKAQSLVGKAENQRKFAVAERWCEQQSWQFQVITDADLTSSYRVQNIIWLTRFARYSIGDEFRQAVKAYLARIGQPVAIAEVCKQIKPDHPQQAFIPLFGLIYHQYLQVELDQQLLSVNSPVQWGSTRLDTGGGS